MAEAYFDTSVLLKRYLEERGTPAARRLMQAYGIVSSALAPLEAFSALSRLHAGGELRRQDFNSIVAELRNETNLWDLVEVQNLVLRRAEAVIARSRIRTLDALHVASALLFRENSSQPLPFITADLRQAAAARAHGLEVVAL